MLAAARARPPSAPVGAAGALGRAQRLQQLQPGREVAQRDPAALEREAEVVRGRGLVGAVHLGPADVAASNRDQALGLEDPDRLADRWVAHAELVDELVLGGQAVDLLAGTARRMRWRSSAATVSAMRSCGTRGRERHPYKYCKNSSYDR